MPVTVKIEDKSRKRAAATPGAPPPAQLSDYAVSSERGEGIKAFIIWLMVMLMLCGVPLALPATQPFGIGLTVWWIVSVFIYYVLAPRMVLRRLRLHGAEYEITAKKAPRLKTLLSKGSAMLGISEPEGFMPDEATPQVRLLGRKDPYFFIVNKGACELLAPPELDCLALRCLVHGAQRHISRLMLIQFLSDTPAPARLLVWPVNLYATLLQMAWLESAHQTADRLTLLLVRDHKLLLRSILKLHSVSDPIMTEAEITPQDVEDYVNQAGRISVEGREISTQYKIGTAISANPYLDERIKELNEWARSKEFQDALQKLAEARSKHASTA
jgi:hypothetical protein